MRRPKIVKKHPSPGCSCKRGAYFRVDLSRMEDGLGHVGYQCDACGDLVKVVTEQASQGDRRIGGVQ